MTPSVNTTTKQICRASGQITSLSSGKVTPRSWESEELQTRVVRPASTSNPVRKDGTRAQGSWRRTIAFTRPGYGFLTASSSGTLYEMSGNVTVPYRDPVQVNHTMALQLLNEARMRALSGLSSGKSQFNVAAHELKGTLKTFDKFLKKATDGVLQVGKQLSRKDPRYFLPPRAWKDAPGDYLGYLYGLKPLADDIGNGLDQLSGLAKRGMSYGYVVRSSLKREEPLFEDVLSVNRFFLMTAIGGTRRSFGRVGYYYSFPDWWIQNVPIVTPFSDAYELTRYSFVLDWALPLGSYVGAMEASQFDPYFKTGFEVYGTDENLRGPFLKSTANPYPSSVMTNDEFHCRRFNMARSVVGSRPTGRVVFPSFRKFLNLDKTAQALALFTQAFSTPPSRR